MKMLTSHLLIAFLSAGVASAALAQNNEDNVGAKIPKESVTEGAIEEALKKAPPGGLSLGGPEVDGEPFKDPEAKESLGRQAAPQQRYTRPQKLVGLWGCRMSFQRAKADAQGFKHPVIITEEMQLSATGTVQGRYLLRASSGSYPGQLQGEWGYNGKDLVMAGIMQDNLNGRIRWFRSATLVNDTTGFTKLQGGLNVGFVRCEKFR